MTGNQHSTFSNQKELHLFDFDGTITIRDSLLDFGSFAVGSFRSKLYLAFVTPLILMMKWGVVSGGDAKVLFLKLHFKGRSRLEMDQLAQAYFHGAVASGLIRPKALVKLDELKKAGHAVCIVSASLDIWLQPFADHFKTDLICSVAEFKNDLFTGELAGKNCNFGQKAKLVKAKYNLSDFSRVVAYGDSGGDKALLSIADQGLMRPFE